ncbi:hypothetical protein Ahy_B04g072171 [Arachis hypogaea]|uniref:Myb/SANT-like domain-containing protein n=1 Tax=Arachis hypogaea TaxID=3818 RepID=A0A444ZMM2_ARAHY|nr:hypothetical protein Ahy_B04g072171 [Arachis hypogaea]
MHRQLKNRWDALKSYFQLWAKLVGQETSLNWDHEKKTVLTSEFWGTDEIKNEGPKSLYRFKQCFKNIVAIGYGAWAPSKDSNPEKFNNQNNEDFESEGDINYINKFIEEDIANYTIVHSPTREKRRKTSSKRLRNDQKLQLRKISLLHRKLHQVATKLPDLEPYSPQFYLGIRSIAKPQYRKTFITLSDDPNQ